MALAFHPDGSLPPPGGSWRGAGGGTLIMERASSKEFAEEGGWWKFFVADRFEIAEEFGESSGEGVLFAVLIDGFEQWERMVAKY